MTDSPSDSYNGPEDDFDMYPHGVQWWEQMTVRMLDGRAHIVIKGEQTFQPIELTRLQTEVLAGWLAMKVAIDI